MYKICLIYHFKILTYEYISLNCLIKVCLFVFFKQKALDQDLAYALVMQKRMREEIKRQKELRRQQAAEVKRVEIGESKYQT